MKKITLMLLVMLAFCWQTDAQTSTLYLSILDTGFCCNGEKWVSITTGPDGTGTVIFAQGNGTYSDGSGHITDAMFTVDDGVTYYINAYDQYDDSWDGDTYEIRSAPAGGGFLIANNSGATPDDGNDEDASFNWGDTQEQELEVSESFSYTPPVCMQPSATATGVDDCDNSQFSINVDITDLGDATSVTVSNDGGVAATTGITSTGVVTIGPFPIGTPVTATVEHEQDAACNVTLSSVVNDICPIFSSVDCAAGTPVNTTFCYGNNEDIRYTFTSSDGTELRVSFIEGYFEDCCDDIIIYDGLTTSDPVLFMSDTNFGNDATGISATSTGDSVLVRLVSDGSVSCDSGSGSPDLNFNVACNTCIPATATASVVEDCANSGGFNVVVDITDLGSATSITLSDDQGSASQNVMAIGMYTFGPYVNGTDVTVTLVDDADAACTEVFSGLMQDVCPPANDECANAEALTVNGDLACSTVTSGTIAGATASAEDDTACSGTEDDDVWYSFMATATSHTIDLLNVANGTTDLYHSVWEGTCGSLTLVAGSCSDPNSSTVTGLTIGNTYLLRVYSWTATSGQTSTFDVCIGTAPAPPANDECANAEALTVNTDGTCTITTTGTLVSSTDSAVATSCDTAGTELDVWYSFVAPASGNVDFTVTLGTGNALEYAIFDDCAGTTEIACADPLDGTSITGLTPGTTYYLLVWNDSFETPGDFTICASEPTCTPATVTYTVVSDCDVSGGFNIEVDITDVGTATDITVSDDQGSANQTTMTATTLTFGPYVNATDVIITVADDNDSNCDQSSAALTQAACPPSNNDCSGAIALTPGGLFEDNPVVGTNLGATGSGELPLPGCAVYDPGDATGFGGDVWYSVTVPSDGNLTIQTNANPTGSGGDGGMAVYSGDCGSLTLVECDDDDSPDGAYSQVVLEPVDGLADQVVYVRVWEFGGNAELNFQVSAYSASLSIDDVANPSAFTYYPNPVKNTLTLNAQNTIENVTMYNMLGQEVLKATPNALDSDLDMSSLQDGTYFVKVTIANITQTIRVIKQ